MRVLYRLIYLSLIFVTIQASAQVVDISDSNLKQVIREELKLPDGSPITQREMVKLQRLDAGGDRGITDLTGLEAASNLKRLGLYHNPRCQPRWEGQCLRPSAGCQRSRHSRPGPQWRWHSQHS